MEKHDLSAIHETRTGEGNQLALLLAPSGQRGGPLAGTAQREHLLAGLDHAAIDQTGHDRRQLSRDDREHRLVEEPEPVLNLPLLDESPTLHMTGAGDEVCVSKAITNLGDARCGSVRGVSTALREMLLGDGQKQITLLHAVMALDEPLRPREPAARLSRLASKEKAETQPEGTAGGAHSVAGLLMCVMSTIEEPVKVEVSAGQVRRCRQQLQILDSQRGRLICE
jgi:hypothetical protein